MSQPEGRSSFARRTFRAGIGAALAAPAVIRTPGRNGRISIVDSKPAPTRPLALLVCLFDNLIAKLKVDEDDRAAALSELAVSDAELLP